MSLHHVTAQLMDAPFCCQEELLLLLLQLLPRTVQLSADLGGIRRGGGGGEFATLETVLLSRQSCEFFAAQEQHWPLLNQHRGITINYFPIIPVLPCPSASSSWADNVSCILLAAVLSFFLPRPKFMTHGSWFRSNCDRDQEKKETIEKSRKLSPSSSLEQYRIVTIFTEWQPTEFSAEEKRWICF